jgi:hypothetical protein
MSSPAPLLEEQDAGTQWSEETLDGVLNRLDENFTFDQLANVLHQYQSEEHPHPEFRNRIMQRMMMLARANYEMRFPAESDISERVIFPVSANELRGIEDARFVRFTEDGGGHCYLATYTAFDGFNVVTQLLETPDFINFKVHTMNGRHSQTKGMAFFPRKIDGKYAMISRVDGENLYLTYSDTATPPRRTLGIYANRKLRLAHRNRGGVAGPYPRRRALAALLHRRAALGQK